jgi:hypothetical protein
MGCIAEEYGYTYGTKYWKKSEKSNDLMFDKLKRQGPLSRLTKRTVKFPGPSAPTSREQQMHTKHRAKPWRNVLNYQLPREYMASIQIQTDDEPKHALK